MKTGAGGWCHTNTDFIWHWASERTTHPTFTVYEQLLWNQPFNKCLTSLCHFFPLYDTMTTLHRWLSNRPWKWFSLCTKCPECVQRACVILCEAITTFSRETSTDKQLGRSEGEFDLWRGWHEYLRCAGNWLKMQTEPSCYSSLGNGYK